MDKEHNEKKQGNQSLHRILDILEYLSSFPPTNISELSRKLDMNRATAYSTVRVLENRGYILRDSKGNYYLSGKMLELGSNYYYARFPLSQMLGDYAKPLIKRYPHCSVCMSTVGGAYHATVIRVIASPEKPDVLIPPGMSIPFHASASGKVLLSFLPIEMQNFYYQTANLTPRTHNTITTLDTLRAEIKRVKELGYATEYEEYILGFSCVAFPLLSANGICKAAISVNAPSDFMKKNEKPIKENLKQLVAVINRFEL